MLRASYKIDRAMRMTAVLLGTLAMAIIPSYAWAYTFDDVEVTYWTGEEPDDGVNEALMVVDWQIPGQDSLVLGYRWTGDAVGADMLNAIGEPADDRFYLAWHAEYEVAVYGIGWDADGDGFEETDPDDYYAEGWYANGSWRYYRSTNGEDWTYVAGIGVSAYTLTLSDGDWDGWSWAPGQQISEPDNLPETAVVGILGDSNGDDIVDYADYENLLAQFGGVPASGEYTADFNHDSVVDLVDFAILRANFAPGSASESPPEFGEPTPEPTTLMLLVLGGSALLARSRG